MLQEGNSVLRVVLLETLSCFEASYLVEARHNFKLVQQDGRCQEADQQQTVRAASRRLCRPQLLR